MTDAPPARVSCPFTAPERELIRRELGQHFGQLPSVADACSCARGGAGRRRASPSCRPPSRPRSRAAWWSCAWAGAGRGRGPSSPRPGSPPRANSPATRACSTPSATPTSTGNSGRRWKRSKRREWIGGDGTRPLRTSLKHSTSKMHPRPAWARGRRRAWSRHSPAGRGRAWCSSGRARWGESCRSAGRGSAAAGVMRLALRSSSSVATNKANPSRCFLDEPAKPPEAQGDFWQALVGGTVRERPPR